eukprot:gene4366-3176_t
MNESNLHALNSPLSFYAFFLHENSYGGGLKKVGVQLGGDQWGVVLQDAAATQECENAALQDARAAVQAKGVNPTSIKSATLAVVGDHAKLTCAVAREDVQQVNQCLGKCKFPLLIRAYSKYTKKKKGGSKGDLNSNSTNTEPDFKRRSTKPDSALPDTKTVPSSDRKPLITGSGAPRIGPASSSSVGSAAGRHKSRSNSSRSEPELRAKKNAPSAGPTVRVQQAHVNAGSSERRVSEKPPVYPTSTISGRGQRHGSVGAQKKGSVNEEVVSSPSVKEVWLDGCMGNSLKEEKEYCAVCEDIQEQIPSSFQKQNFSVDLFPRDEGLVMHCYFKELGKSSIRLKTREAELRSCKFKRLLNIHAKGPRLLPSSRKSRKKESGSVFQFDPFLDLPQGPAPPVPENPTSGVWLSHFFDEGDEEMVEVTPRREEALQLVERQISETVAEVRSTPTHKSTVHHRRSTTATRKGFRIDFEGEAWPLLLTSFTDDFVKALREDLSNAFAIVGKLIPGMEITFSPEEKGGVAEVHFSDASYSTEEEDNERYDLFSQYFFSNVWRVYNHLLGRYEANFGSSPDFTLLLSGSEWPRLLSNYFDVFPKAALDDAYLALRAAGEPQPPLIKASLLLQGEHARLLYYISFNSDPGDAKRRTSVLQSYPFPTVWAYYALYSMSLQYGMEAPEYPTSKRYTPFEITPMERYPTDDKPKKSKFSREESPSVFSEESLQVERPASLPPPQQPPHPSKQCSCVGVQTKYPFHASIGLQTRNSVHASVGIQAIPHNCPTVSVQTQNIPQSTVGMQTPRFETPQSSLGCQTNTISQAAAGMQTAPQNCPTVSVQTQNIPQSTVGMQTPRFETPQSSLGCQTNTISQAAAGMQTAPQNCPTVSVQTQNIPQSTVGMQTPRFETPQSSLGCQTNCIAQSCVGIQTQRAHGSTVGQQTFSIPQACVGIQAQSSAMLAKYHSVGLQTHGTKQVSVGLQKNGSSAYNSKVPLSPAPAPSVPAMSYPCGCYCPVHGSLSYPGNTAGKEVAMGETAVRDSVALFTGTTQYTPFLVRSHYPLHLCLSAYFAKEPQSHTEQSHYTAMALRSPLEQSHYTAMALRNPLEQSHYTAMGLRSPLERCTKIQLHIPHDPLTFIEMSDLRPLSQVLLSLFLQNYRLRLQQANAPSESAVGGADGLYRVGFPGREWVSIAGRKIESLVSTLAMDLQQALPIQQAVVEEIVTDEVYGIISKVRLIGALDSPRRIRELLRMASFPGMWKLYEREQFHFTPRMRSIDLPPVKLRKELDSTDRYQSYVCTYSLHFDGIGWFEILRFNKNMLVQAVEKDVMGILDGVSPSDIAVSNPTYDHCGVDINVRVAHCPTKEVRYLMQPKNFKTVWRLYKQQKKVIQSNAGVKCWMRCFSVNHAFASCPFSNLRDRKSKCRHHMITQQESYVYLFKSLKLPILGIAQVAVEPGGEHHLGIGMAQMLLFQLSAEPGILSLQRCNTLVGWKELDATLIFPFLSQILELQLRARLHMRDPSIKKLPLQMVNQRRRLDLGYMCQRCRELFSMPTSTTSVTSAGFSILEKTTREQLMYHYFYSPFFPIEPKKVLKRKLGHCENRTRDPHFTRVVHCHCFNSITNYFYVIKPNGRLGLCDYLMSDVQCFLRCSLGHLGGRQKIMTDILARNTFGIQFLVGGLGPVVSTLHLRAFFRPSLPGLVKPTLFGLLATPGGNCYKSMHPPSITDHILYMHQTRQFFERTKQEDESFAVSGGRLQ